MKQLFEETKERLIRYAKINTRSDEHSDTIPSTKCQLDLLYLLKEELEEIGMEEVEFNEENGFITATLPSNIDHSVPTIGWIAHVDTADFNSENVRPQVIENYNGGAITLNEDQNIAMDENMFPNLANYKGDTLITTDGTTLLGADDKAGIAEIMTAMHYLIRHPEVPHGKIRVAFGPDEEIGKGADRFDVESFGADFSYTMDGGVVGELQYESFNAAACKVTFKGQNIHPGTAKGLMINAITLLNQFIQALPQNEVPEMTSDYDGFYHVMEIDGTVDEAHLSMIIRDHDRDLFEKRKQLVKAIVEKLNEPFERERITLEMFDQYYNMREIIEQDMSIVNLAATAMRNLNIEPIIEPIRGGTDGSKLSFMGLPTPNIFTGAENMHGRYEFVAVESMVKATQVILEIINQNALL